MDYKQKLKFTVQKNKYLINKIITLYIKLIEHHITAYIKIKK